MWNDKQLLDNAKLFDRGQSVNYLVTFKTEKKLGLHLTLTKKKIHSSNVVLSLNQGERIFFTIEIQMHRHTSKGT